MFDEILEFLRYSPNQWLIGTSFTSMLFFICCKSATYVSDVSCHSRFLMKVGSW